MKTLLYITAHPLNELVSTSMAAGKAFKESYKLNHPEDDIIHIDLFKDYIPQIDSDIFSAWGKIQKNEPLTDIEKQKTARLEEIVEQFISADKYVFVTPMWNLSFPPVLKAYIDAVSVAGKTFKYSKEGPIGLLTKKKALHIQSRGGYYSESPFAELESGDRYIKAMMDFYGVPSYESIIIEGHNAESHKAEEIKQEGIREAQKLGESF